MPLHLLGKKSWNVYNPQAIARVRADESRAAEVEERNEIKRKAYEAEHRLAILRGTTPPAEPLLEQVEYRPKRDFEDGKTRDAHDAKAKRRRLAGEDDTDRDVRLAREAVDEQLEKREASASKRHRASDAPLTDNQGHIQLFVPSAAPARPRVEKNAEAEQEKRQKQRDLEDQYTMRFSNAAGNRVDIKDKPWYDDGVAKPSSKDAFGRDDQARGTRNDSRMASADPMASMRRAQQKLKDNERAREAWQKERDEETRRGSSSRRETGRQRHGKRDALNDDPLRLDGRHSHRSSSQHDNHRHDREGRRHHHDHERKGEYKKSRGVGQGDTQTSRHTHRRSERDDYKHRRHHEPLP